MKTFRTESIKRRITMWYSVFIVVIIAFLVCVLLISQNLSSQDYYEDLLAENIANAAASLHTMEDTANIIEDMDRGVHIAVLDENGKVLYGRRSFDVSPKEGSLRIRRADSGNFWYLMDKPVTLEDGKCVWLRGYISSAISERYNQTLMIFVMSALPLFLLIAVFGGVNLTKRAFRPLDAIIHTAEGISASTDLKQRFRCEDQADEVASLADTFDAMLERLEKSIEDEKTFISDASHELRTPISVIRAQSEYALGPERTLEEKDAALEIILNRSTKAGQMISQMLLLSRMDFDRVHMNIERIDLSELFGQIVMEMAPRSNECGITLKSSIESGVLCYCDELLMIRMVTNLLENALQYGREGGYVCLMLARKGNRIEIGVADDGIGISEEHTEKIWQRFYQVNKTGNRNSGFGLGLSIVQWIVQAHGGEISVASKLGEGSVFTVTMPVGGNDATIRI